MGHYFFTTLKAVIELSNEEFELLFNEAARHYDFTVKSTTQVEGVLYGFRNRRLFAQESGTTDNEVEFIERDLGIMMKALEMTGAAAGAKLYMRFLRIAKELQQKTVDVNQPLNNVKISGQFIDD